MIKQTTFLKILVLVGIVQLLISCNSTEPVIKHVSVQGKSVDAIVELMTLEEKVGQMTQAERRYLIDEKDIKD